MDALSQDKLYVHMTLGVMAVGGNHTISETEFCRKPPSTIADRYGVTKIWESTWCYWTSSIYFVQMENNTSSYLSKVMFDEERQFKLLYAET
jgi:hypothetical protein